MVVLKITIVGLFLIMNWRFVAFRFLFGSKCKLAQSQCPHSSQSSGVSQKFPLLASALLSKIIQKSAKANY